MGPLLLIDKSCLRMMNPKEAKSLQKHYSLVLCPVLLEELISDLADPSIPSEDQVKSVVRLVSKANGLDTFTLPDARALIQAELLGGEKVSTEPGIPRFGGRNIVGPDGSRGVIFEESFEAKLLRNWSNGMFSQKDHEVAGQLKRDFIKYDLPSSQKKMRGEYPNNTKFKSLTEIASFVDVNEKILTSLWSVIETLAHWALMDKTQIDEVRVRWENAGSPSLKEFAPYSYFCNRVLAIYFLGVTAALIKTGKDEKTMVDMFYFLYLPFVHEFASRDNFHRELFSLFSRSDQGFIWGDDLKPDLAQIASFHEAMNPEERKYFAKEFGSYPPPIPSSLTREIWGKHMRPWEPGSGNRAIDMSPEEQKKIIDELKKKTGMF